MKKLILLSLVALSLFAGNKKKNLDPDLNSGSTERIWFYSDDFSSAMRYTAKRYNEEIGSSYLFEEGFDKKLIHYIRPSGFKWTKDKIDGIKYESLDLGSVSSYGYLENMPDNNEFYYKRNNGTIKLFAGAIGCNNGEGCYYEDQVTSAIIPKRYKVMSYHAGLDKNTPCKGGEWKVIDNTYTFYMKHSDGCNLYFELQDIKK